MVACSDAYAFNVVFVVIIGDSHPHGRIEIARFLA
jgi:hypothetical protein